MENISKLIKDKKSQPRLLKAMEPVLKNPEIIEKIGPDKIIYDVYREVKLICDLGYDLTFLHSTMLGNELPKTYGHYHYQQNMAEIMEAVDGKVWWLLQKYENNPEIITEAYLVEAKEYEKAIFLPGFGIISINPLEKELILSNWQSINMQGNYEPYSQLHGACYYFYKNTEGKIEWQKNENYKEVPELIKLKPKEIPELGIIFDKPLLDFTEKELEFLNNTQKYKNILTINSCYERI